MTLIFLLANVFIKKTSDRQVEKEPIYQNFRQRVGLDSLDCLQY